MFVLNPEHCPGPPRRATSTSMTWTFYTLTTTCCQIDLHQAVPRRLLHRPRLPAGAQRHRQLFRPGLHRHPVQPERPARRPEHRQLRLRHGPRRAKDLCQALPAQPGPARWSCSCDAGGRRRKPPRSSGALMQTATGPEPDPGGDKPAIGRPEAPAAWAIVRPTRPLQACQALRPANAPRRRPTGPPIRPWRR